MSTPAHRVAARLAALGPGGVRIAQLLALRLDLFDAASARALAVRHPDEAAPPAAARARIAAELGRPLEAILPAWIAAPTGGSPLAWAARGRTPEGSELMVRVALPERAPDAAMIQAALRRAAPLLPRGLDRAALARELRRAIAAELDLAEQHRRLGAMRRAALSRTGTLVARARTPAAAHTIGLAALAGLAVPQVAGLLGSPALEAHDIDASNAAAHLVDAGLEQLFVFDSAPLEPRLDLLVLLPGSRVARADLGAVEPLSAALREGLPRLLRALVAGDPGLLAAQLTAQLDPGPAADPAGFARAVEVAWQRCSAGAFADFLHAILAAARAHQLRVPADLLAVARWTVAIATVARRLDPQLALGDRAHAFLLHRELERLFELPASATLARDMLDVIGPLIALPARIDRLLAQASDRDYRLPVDWREPAADRAARRDQHRLVGAALFWVGSAILLLAPQRATGWLATTETGLLCAMAAASAVAVLIFWRRLA